jgi:hypothetical protein
MSYRVDRGRITAALTAVLVAAACGGGEPGEEPAEGGAAGGAGGATASPVDAATAGSIAGRVTFTGTAPAGTPIEMDEPVCQAKHTTPPTRGGAKVAADGGLADVFVYLKTGPGTTMTFPAPTEQEVLDQVGCIYVPHVLGLQTGQPILVRNSDAVLHNINSTGGSANRGFNRSQPTAGLEMTERFTAPEVMIPVRCDVHGWMEAFIGVTSHPYHAVTDQSGSFTLPNVPPGDYEVEAWHELFGTQTGTVTVAPSGRADLNLTFSAEQAGRYVPMGPALVLDHATGTLRREGTGRPAQLGPHTHAGHN